ncbi:Sugar transport protein [Candidatus Burarchaeum australiense]|nr:Sugar transport protein [Candidatus Burarchaeum australiense]
MENWILLGILAAVAFGISTLLNKVASGQNYFALEPRTAALFVGIGILVTFAAYFMFNGSSLALPNNNLAMVVALAAGIFWAVGTLCVLMAFAGGAEAARLAPIFNMNTLVVVGLGIVLLHEVPQQPQMLRVVAGAVLVVIGGILVSI